MNILFISYWGIKEGLTQSTVLPHLKILSQYDTIKRIILITIEHTSVSKSEKISEKVDHIAIPSKSLSIPAFGKLIDFIIIPKILKRHCIEFGTDKIIARGSMAGALAYLTSRKINIPYYVESFEPHADYMRDAGIWFRWGLKYIFQKIWEKKQCQSATGIMTVTKNYTDFLKTSVSNDIIILTVPCAVDYALFKFNEKNRKTIRRKLGFNEDQMIGIYAGKFGGLYLNVTELDFINEIIKFYPDLGLIFLTPIPEEIIRRKVKLNSDSNFKLIIKHVKYYDVPSYLSASDFALSLVRPFNSGKYSSPVKHGEYWANGLPILMTEGIGDENNFLEEEKGGVLFNPNNITVSLRKLDELINDPDHRKRIPELAQKYRSFKTVDDAYKKLILPQIVDLVQDNHRAQKLI
jgi:hypothetical protein